MKKALRFFYIFGAFVSASFAANVTHNYVLNSQPVNLQANETRTDTAVSVAAKPSYDMTTFNCNTNITGACTMGSNLAIQGASGAKYTLQINDQTTTFFAKSLTLTNAANATINGFHTISFESGSVSVGESASLTVTNSGATQINAQGSEYGGLTKVRFASGVGLNLSANSSANLNGIIFFSSQGSVNLGANSSLNITAPVIRFEKSFTNNGGTALFTTGTSASLNIGVYNVSNDSVAVFTHNGGTTTINGDFYNGGTTIADGGAFGVQDPVAKGGGRLVINGGTMSVTGKLVSQSDGLTTTQNSSIDIYGGTLIVGGGLQNKQGSTLTFGIGTNGTMGKFQGTLSNEGGVVAVDKTGAALGQSYTIITGTANISAVSLVGANAQFFTATYSGGSVTITDGSENGGNSKFDEYKENLNSGENAIANSLVEKFGGSANLLNSDLDIQTALADTDKALKNAAVTQPKSLINAFRGDALLAPIQSTFVARRLAAASNVRLDSGRRVRVLAAKPSRDFYLAPVGALLRADEASGYLAGFTLGSNYKMGALTNRIYAAYAYGAARQDLSSQSSDTTAHLLQLGTLNRYAQGIWEFDINANFLFGAFAVDNEWHQAPTLNSTSKFNNYQLNLGLLAGARFGKTLSIKPFVGVENYAEMQSAFKSILGFEAQGYKAYILGGVAGVEGHYLFNKNAAVYGKIGFESRLYNSHKHLFLRSLNNEISYENKAYDNALSLNLGAQLFAWGRFRLNLEGLFKHYDSGLNYYGGNLGFRWVMR